MFITKEKCCEVVSALGHSPSEGEIIYGHLLKLKFILTQGCTAQEQTTNTYYAIEELATMTDEERKDYVSIISVTDFGDYEEPEEFSDSLSSSTTQDSSDDVFYTSSRLADESTGEYVLRQELLECKDENLSHHSSLSLILDTAVNTVDVPVSGVQDTGPESMALATTSPVCSTSLEPSNNEERVRVTDTLVDSVVRLIPPDDDYFVATLGEQKLSSYSQYSHVRKTRNRRLKLVSKITHAERLKYSYVDVEKKKPINFDAFGLMLANPCSEDVTTSKPTGRLLRLQRALRRV